jgi:hypothetical protein
MMRFIPCQEIHAHKDGRVIDEDDFAAFDAAGCDHSEAFGRDGDDFVGGAEEGEAVLKAGGERAVIERKSGYKIRHGARGGNDTCAVPVAEGGGSEKAGDATTSGVGVTGVSVDAVRGMKPVDDRGGELREDSQQTGERAGGCLGEAELARGQVWAFILREVGCDSGPGEEGKEEESCCVPWVVCFKSHLVCFGGDVEFTE